MRLSFQQRQKETEVKRSVRVVMAALACAVLLGLVACGPTTPSSTTPPLGNTTPATSTPAPIRIGVLPTEDSLPLWVAEQKGLFTKAGLNVTLTMFQSAQERDAALTAGAIDGFMGDPIAAALLRNGGVPVKITTIMLGATAQQGRFGIALKPGSKITSLKQLANVPIGTSTATIQEYVLDELMLAAGVPASQIKTNEVPKVPVRFQLLMSGKLEAAALPEPFLSLAEKTGAKVIADDTTGPNISQTVLVFSQKYLDSAAGSSAVTSLLKVWDQSVAIVNLDPNSFRSLLVDKARLPAPLATSYQVNTYPTAQLPTPAEIDAVLTWMKSHSLLKAPITYSDLTWTAPAQ
jgi:NitT/TauT family transport system substrate-binding protein